MPRAPMIRPLLHLSQGARLHGNMRKQSGVAAAASAMKTVSPDHHDNQREGDQRTENAASSSSSSSGGQKQEIFWMKDPKSGNWIPESHFGEIDVADLRKDKLLSSSSKRTINLM